MIVVGTPCSTRVCQKGVPRRSDVIFDESSGKTKGPSGRLNRGSVVFDMEENGCNVAASRCTKSKMPCCAGLKPVIRLDQATGLCGGVVVASFLKLPLSLRCLKFGSSSQCLATKPGSIPSTPITMNSGTRRDARNKWQPARQNAATVITITAGCARTKC